MGKCTIIAMANQKGGVAKTTSTHALGEALGEMGKRVLLVDMDPQSSLTISCGIDPAGLDDSLYGLLTAKVVTRTAVLSKIAHVDKFHLLPTSIDLAAAELTLTAEMGREARLADVLKQISFLYDYILIDCPPSLNLLTLNALTAADQVLIPLLPEYLALRGLEFMLDTMERVKQRLNPNLGLLGILVTRYQKRLVHANEVLTLLESQYPEKVIPFRVPSAVSFAEAPVGGQSMLSYAPTSDGAMVYRQLAEWVVGMA